jgi:hypothetical protein
MNDNNILQSLRFNELEPFLFLSFQPSQLLRIAGTLPYPWSKLVEQKGKDTHDCGEDSKDGASPPEPHYFDEK